MQSKYIQWTRSNFNIQSYKVLKTSEEYETLEQKAWSEKFITSLEFHLQAVTWRVPVAVTIKLLPYNPFSLIYINISFVDLIQLYAYKNSEFSVLMFLLKILFLQSYFTFKYKSHQGFEVTLEQLNLLLVIHILNYIKTKMTSTRHFSSLRV